MGCHRTIDEIAHWAALSDDEKLSVLEKIDQRALTKGTS